MQIDLRQWKYFLTLEDDFIRTLRFVDLDEENYKTFSIEFSKLLLLIGAEFESVAKGLINTVEPDTKVGDIADIKRGLLSNFSRLCENEVRIPNSKLVIKPFENWDIDCKLEWWEAYNNLKHNRLNNFKDAKLKNVLFGIGGLLIILIYLYRYRDKENDLLSVNNFFEADGMGELLNSSSIKDIPDKRDEQN